MSRTLRMILTEFCDRYPNKSSHDVARRVVDEVPLEDIVSMLAGEIDWTRRVRVRFIEQTAFDETFNIVPGRFHKLFAEKFALGDGVEVTWGAATVAQHMMRIAMLEKQVGGLNATIERHRTAISLIEQGNASCLDELAE